MKAPELCEACHTELPAGFDGKVCAEKLPCLERHVERLNVENNKLKDRVKFWNEAWYEVRDLLGNLWWHHPAIDNDEQRAYYQQNLRGIERINKRIARGLCTNLKCEDCLVKEFAKPVAYDGFIGTDADWHYQAWIKRCK